MKKNNWLKTLSCSVFAGLYLIVAVISLICSTEFFKLAHSGIMSWVLAIGFEIGAMSCLLSTLILPKKKLGLVWFMFIVLTLFQCMGNMYAAFINLENFQDWIDMFGMMDMELIAQKRVLAGISGVILPLVALGFIRIMADVLQDGHDIEINDSNEAQEQEPPVLFGQSKPEENIDIENTKEKEQENKLTKGISGTYGPIESFNKTAKKEQETNETIEKHTEKKQEETNGKSSENVQLAQETKKQEKEPKKNQTAANSSSARLWTNNNKTNQEIG